MGLGFGLRCWPECLNGRQEAGGRSTKLFSELQCQMGNGKFSIYHLTFLMSLKSKKTELPAVCRLPPASCSCFLLLLPAPASCSCVLPSSRSMQPQAKLIIDCNRLCPSIRKQTTLTQDHWQATRRSFRSECRA